MEGREEEVKEGRRGENGVEGMHGGEVRRFATSSIMCTMELQARNHLVPYGCSVNHYQFIISVTLSPP
jgi:hypothetical protein